MTIPSVKGTILTITEMQQIGKKGTDKRSILLLPEQETDNEIFIDFWGEKASDLEDFQKGEKVEVTFMISSKEWNGKYFTNLFAKSIESLGVGEKQPSQEDEPEEISNDNPFGSFGDDIPF